VRPGRVDQRTEGGHVVLEGVLGFDEDHVGVRVECLGDVHAAVPAADHNHLAHGR